MKLLGNVLQRRKVWKEMTYQLVFISLDFFFWEPVAWVLNNTLRQNILFGSALDESKYNKIIQCCALDKDVKLFPGGHEQEIGESGINLEVKKKNVNQFCHNYSNLSHCICYFFYRSKAKISFGESIVLRCRYLYVWWTFRSRRLNCCQLDFPRMFSEIFGGKNANIGHTSTPISAICRSSKKLKIFLLYFFFPVCNSTIWIIDCCNEKWKNRTHW